MNPYCRYAPDGLQDRRRGGRVRQLIQLTDSTTTSQWNGECSLPFPEAMMALRPLRNVSISFGLVSIPVRFYTATKSEDVHFNLLHASRSEEHTSELQSRF